MLEKTIFIPGCKAVGELTEKGQTIECNPKIIKGNKKFSSARPVIIFLDRQSNKASLEDDGDASEELLDKLMKHIGRKRIR